MRVVAETGERDCGSTQPGLFIGSRAPRARVTGAREHATSCATPGRPGAKAAGSSALISYCPDPGGGGCAMGKRTGLSR